MFKMTITKTLWRVTCVITILATTGCACCILDKPVENGVDIQGTGVSRLNHPPKITTLYASKTGKRVRVIKPGMKVTAIANATDSDKDKLNYAWSIAPGAGKLIKSDGPKVTWVVGNPSGHGDLKVTVTDSKGGIAQRKLKIDDKVTLTFSGHVLTVSDKPVADAKVDVNGAKTSTGKDGRFKIQLTETEAEHFILTVRKPGFGFISRLYDSAISDGKWRLPRAKVISVDPTQQIAVQATMSTEDCTGPMSSRFNWTDYPEQAVPRYISPNGQITVGQFPTDLKDALALLAGGTPCDDGFSVVIPANSLVDEKGNLARGLVDVSISSVDLYSADGMPGDYTVRTKDGVRTMRTFGAGIIDIYSGNTQYQLKKGKTAKITIPIDPVIRKSYPKKIQKQIPLLVYAPKTGEWQVEGTAELNAKGNAYSAAVKHFSAWNSDLVKTDQSCVRIDSSGIIGNYSLEVTIPTSTGAPSVRTYVIDNTSEQLHAIYNLPNFTNIGLVPFRDEAGGPVPLGNFGVNTGDQQINPQQNEPPYPYTNCRGSINLFEIGGGGTPLSPTNLSVEWLTLSALNLSWNDNANNETSYKIYMSIDGANGSYFELVSLAANTTSEQITEMEACQSAWFKVIASNGTGYSNYSNTAQATSDTTAVITISNELISPLVGGTYFVGCWDAATTAGGLGIMDKNGNGLLDNETGGNASRVYVREPVLRGDLSGFWDLNYGKKYDSPANLALLTRFSTITSYPRDQFMVLHLNVNEATGAVSGVSMWGGDMNNVVDGPFGEENGIVMATTPNANQYINYLNSFSPNVTDIGGYLPTDVTGYLFGRATGLIIFTPEAFGNTYSNAIDMQFNIPLYYDQ